MLSHLESQLAARNVLIGGDGEPKISDFGMSHQTAPGAKTESFEGYVETLAHMSQSRG